MAAMSCVDTYNIDGPTILHQEAVVDLISEAVLISEEEATGYQRGLCGGMWEKSSSTIEVPDIDINARFHLNSDWIQVCTTNTSFLYEIQVKSEHKHQIDNIATLMQHHGDEDKIDCNSLEKSIEKSYVKLGTKIFLSSHLARWQLVGVIKSMSEAGLEVDQSSRMAGEVGLKNGVYNVMIYDTMVCRRGMLRKPAFKRLVEKKIEQCGLEEDKVILTKNLEVILGFFPSTGIQVDYTAGFHIGEDAVPEEAKLWIKSGKEWPSSSLKDRVLADGALLVPKTFKEDAKTERSRRWRINFNLNMIIDDTDYSLTIDTRRVLKILKDIKNAIFKCNIVKSYFLKLCIAWAMFENQDDRSNMTNEDLLVFSLKFLQGSLKKMTLPDFFNEKFNHFYRHRDKQYEAKRVAEKIDEILKDDGWKEMFEQLKGAQNTFTNEVTRLIQNSKIVLFTNMVTREQWISSINKMLPVLSSFYLGKVFDSIESFKSEVTLNDVIKYTKRQGLKNKTRKPWQPVWKSRLEAVFTGADVDEHEEDVRKHRKENCGGDILAESIMDFYLANIENREDKLLKLQILESLQNILREHLECEVVGFGSTFNCFGLSGCDLDLQIFPKDVGGNKVQFLGRVKTILTAADFISSDVVVRAGARVPIIRTTHKQSGVPLDIGVWGGQSSDNVRATHLFYYCSRQDPRVAPLMCAVKTWAKSQNINDSFKHTFSSHALAIMVLHYLSVSKKCDMLFCSV